MPALTKIELHIAPTKKLSTIKKQERTSNYEMLKKASKAVSIGTETVRSMYVTVSKQVVIA